MTNHTKEILDQLHERGAAIIEVDGEAYDIRVDLLRHDDEHGASIEYPVLGLTEVDLITRGKLIQIAQ